MKPNATSKRAEYPPIVEELVAEGQKLARQLERMDLRTVAAKELRRRHDLVVKAAMWIIGTVEGSKMRGQKR